MPCFIVLIRSECEATARSFVVRAHDVEAAAEAVSTKAPGALIGVGRCSDALAVVLLLADDEVREL